MMCTRRLANTHNILPLLCALFCTAQLSAVLVRALQMANLSWSWVVAGAA